MWIYFKNNTKKSRDISDLLNYNHRLNPSLEAAKISLVYGFVGLIWILFSDELLSRVISDIEIYKKWATYKGWAFVTVTTILIYFLILKRLLILDKAMEEIDNKFDELNSANEELIALEEELRQQYEESEKNQIALDISKQRYELAVEGADCGILLAYYDSLTELPNRISFEAKVTDLINDKDKCDKNFALIHMDIDNFKHINDTLGHTSGDLLLKSISNILKCHVKAPDLVARLSGDEFAIIFNNINCKRDVVDKLQILLRDLRRSWVIEKQEFFISYSIGIVVYPEDGIDLNTLLKNSDIAMHHVKKKMKDNFCFYSIDMQENSLKYIRTVNELRRAIDNEEFTLYFQPIINLDNLKLEGVEALIRWIHPVRGIVSPMEFIPLAEETGLIIEIGKWVLRTALKQKKSWEEQGHPHIKMSVNISGKRITDEDLVNDLKGLILQTELKCEEIQLEVTETAVMKDINKSTRNLNQIKEMGIKVALDDFGTGYSSLTYLKKLPIDIVKLDRDFIKSISNNEKDNVIVESVIKLTHDLNLEIIAEGIETEEQLSFLKLSRCDYGQGYFFSRPITKEETEKLFL